MRCHGASMCNFLLTGTEKGQAGSGVTRRGVRPVLLARPLRGSTRIPDKPVPRQSATGAASGSALQPRKALSRRGNALFYPREALSWNGKALSAFRRALSRPGRALFCLGKALCWTRKDHFAPLEAYFWRRNELSLDLKRAVGQRNRLPTSDRQPGNLVSIPASFLVT